MIDVTQCSQFLVNSFKIYDIVHFQIFFVFFLVFEVNW